MEERNQTICIAFSGTKLIAEGLLNDVALKVKDVIDRGDQETILILDDCASRPIEIDFRGSKADLQKRLGDMKNQKSENVPIPLEQDKPRGPGRPKLGVVAREITLLPRQWEWLNRQPGGASVTLRKLVDKAKRENESKDQLRLAQESAYRFMTTLAGNQPGYEEATRALFAGNRERFGQCVEHWPNDVREHAMNLAARVFDNQL